MEISALSDLYTEATLDSWGKILTELVPPEKTERLLTQVIQKHLELQFEKNK